LIRTSMPQNSVNCSKHVNKGKTGYLQPVFFINFFFFAYVHLCFRLVLGLDNSNIFYLFFICQIIVNYYSNSSGINFEIILTTINIFYIIIWEINCFLKYHILLWEDSLLLFDTHEKSHPLKLLCGYGYAPCISLAH